jgi:hypothetical protein
LEARKQLARSLREAVEADGPPRSRRTALGGVKIAGHWGNALLGIADWLEHADEINRLGFSRAAALVTEACGASFDEADESDGLGELIWWVADGMQLCPPHEWGCPVISKLQPERTAWTCRRCGRVSMSSDLAQQPSDE